MAAERLFQHAGWVTRDLGPDYGLDQHVEIFDGGAATGLFFFTQLKATDQPDLQRALAVSFSASNLDYFEAVDEPVLLMRFHAHSSTLFCRWFHRIDTRSPKTATATIRFSPEGAVDFESMAELRNEVMLFRALRDVIVRWPLVVRISSTNPAVLADDVVVACTATAGTQHYVKYMAPGSTAEGPEATITINDRRIVVHLGVASLTVHQPPEQRTIEDLAGDLVFSTGLCLLVAGHHDPGGRLVRHTVVRAAVARDPDILMRTAAMLAQGRRTHDAIATARSLINAGRNGDAAIIVPFSVMPIATEMVPEERVLVGSFLEELAAAISSEDQAAGARAYYSSGNWHFYINDYASAVAAYERAAKLDATYAERPYYQQEFAGALFENGHYERAAVWYMRALRAAPDQGLLGRLGDCLLHAGRYRHALEILDRYATDPLANEPIWLLKRHAAAHIVDRHGDQQERQPDQAESLAQEALSLGEDPRALQLAEQALTLDALSGSAWWTIGRWQVNTGGDVEKGLHALVIGITQGGGDPNAWIDVIFAAIRGGDEDLVRLVVRAACWGDVSALLEALRRALATVPAEVRGELLRLVSDEAAALPSSEGFTLRVADRSGMIEHRIEPPAS
jgi:tetratricopeptide (TPR) repeat protein